MSVRVRQSCGCHPVGRYEWVAEQPQALQHVPQETCPECGTSKGLELQALTPAGGLTGCLTCGHPELYTTKAFPTYLGIAIVVVAAVLAPATHYISLGVAALLDWALFRLTPNAMVCYVCLASHAGFAQDPRHPAFDREIHERLKFGDKAVMGKPMREGGSAGAPDPEH